MCGRFVYIPEDELTEIIAQVELNLEVQSHPGPYAKDVFPGAEVPVLVPAMPGGSRLEAVAMRWGYPVEWQKQPVFNTRAESAGKAIWADSLRHRRCLVPSYGFYEPHKSETVLSPKTGKPIKRQYFFRLPGSEVLLMAGIFEEGHFSILTTAPNPWMRDIHDRMPVALLPGEYGEWLESGNPALFNRSNVVLECSAV